MSAQKHERRTAERYKYEDNTPREGRFSAGYLKGRRRIRNAEIYDISSEGVSFRIDENYAPELGELIAVEFRLPNAGQMAWYAKVVRTELEYVETARDEYTQVLRIAAMFIDLPELRKKQLGKMIDGLTVRVRNSDQPSRVSILSEALTVRRRHEVTLWRFVRAGFIFAISLFLAFEFITYMSHVGSRYWRGSGPKIWQHDGHTPFEDVGSPIDSSKKNYDE